MIDQRPIKPDKKYLEEYLQKISAVEPRNYLKKKEEPVLPCHALNHNERTEQNVKAIDSRSKAEIYEEIKRKNRQKFGEKQIKEVPIQPKQKIDPKKMTIDYKPRQRVVKIETDEYKKIGFSKKQTESKKQVEAKIQYQKLLDYYRKQIKSFEEQKNKFQQVATKLKFKDMISNQEGLSYSKVKSQVQKKLITQHLSIKSAEVALKECRSQNNQEKNKNKSVDKSKFQKKQGLIFSKTFSIGQIRQCMNETNKRLKQIKHELLKDQIHINQHRYNVHQIYLLPEFTPQALYDYLDISNLKYCNNQQYKTAIKGFNSKFNKDNQKENSFQDLDDQRETKEEIKVKYVGQKRIMKYQGWTEVWIPGKQRLMTNKEGYKVVWLGNGDVLQQFANSISTYFSKSKKILQINYKDQLPIYYHEGQNQIWRVFDNRSKQVIFGNGRKQLFEDKQDFF